jgi:isopropylmalate/homocitrate/citramalate synthase
VPDEVDRLLDVLLPVTPVERLALHLHDTGGRALDNVDAALKHGVAIFDSAAGGMGGCPFAPGAPGNLGTEALVDHLERRGIATGIDAAAVSRAVDALVQQAVTT